MLLAAAAILVGFIILIWSADLFVAGAASIAENMGMSPIIIGLTIVSLGTSAPEILVSLTAAVSNAGDLAIGNAIGSNIANIGLVLGITVLVAPMMVHQSCMKKEMPVLLLVTFGAGMLLIDDELSNLDAGLMMGTLALIIIYMVRSQQQDAVLLEEAEEEYLHHLNPLRAWLTFALGLALLIASSRMLVWGSVTIAQTLGVSELVIGLTIVAIGTSLPELAATIASALRGHTEIALGNVIGSNLFNLLAVMAIPGIVGPESLEHAVITRDYPTMTFLTVFLALAIFISRKRSASTQGHSYVGRTVGMLLVSFYAGYYYWLYLSL
ncbi:calcium/sodium antiporter [Seongchinamella sediminis]|uniref:Calcium/sodium antiporter n=1 Tax=Seongchinamella sediminis TaxID=2283635 RepID=A0A3L7DZ16_9GAMM|nr:calcium/sodium antiporter [Seongchinamella sediminis]RLQ21909.1 calcium/sodium antiporter [Seongchinamella sediminis]